MSKDTLNTKLWKPRSVAETKAIYQEWAADYDADVMGSGYATPKRLAEALADLADPKTTLLDFGCGTGLSGQALRDAGFQTIDGTDITPEMLEKANDKGIYRKTWLSDPGALNFAQGEYAVIVAAGVVSLGAAPPETLEQLIAKILPGGFLAFSYNDPTLADQSYTDALGAILANGQAEVVHRAHGPHLPDKGMGSDVIILRAK